MLSYTDISSDKDYSLDELTPGIRHFVSQKSRVPVGKNKNGSLYYPMQSIEYYSTKAGDIELSFWMRLVEDAVKREDKRELLDAVTDYVKNNCAWLKSREDTRMYALECLCRKSYENWDGFNYEERGAL